MKSAFSCFGACFAKPKETQSIYEPARSSGFTPPAWRADHYDAFPVTSKYAEGPASKADAPLRVEHGHVTAMHRKLILVDPAQPFFAGLAEARQGAAPDDIEQSSGLRLRFGLGRAADGREVVQVVSQKVEAGGYKGFRYGVALPLEPLEPGEPCADSEPELLACLHSYLSDPIYDRYGWPIMVQHGRAESRFGTVSSVDYGREYLLMQQAQGPEAGDGRAPASLKWIFDVNDTAKHSRLTSVPLHTGRDLRYCTQAVKSEGQRLQLGLVALYDMLAGLETAHKAGVVHRDLKLENVMLGADGVFKLVDFGMAFNVHASDANYQKMEVTGTAHYMSPELAKYYRSSTVVEIKREFERAQQTPEAVDIYAAGLTFLTMARGKFTVAPNSSREGYIAKHVRAQEVFAFAWEKYTQPAASFAQASADDGLLADTLRSLDGYRHSESADSPLIGSLIGRHFLAPHAKDRKDAGFLREQVGLALNALRNEDDAVERMRPLCQKLAKDNMDAKVPVLERELKDTAKFLQQKLSAMPSEARAAAVLRQMNGVAPA